jgi:hypothetical protein
VVRHPAGSGRSPAVAAAAIAAIAIALGLLPKGPYWPARRAREQVRHVRAANNNA